jgi:hypothetical protein
MGMIIFIIASGLTLVFGLMDVLNFGHGVFIALGLRGHHGAGAMGDWTVGRAVATWWRCWPGDGMAGGRRRGRGVRALLVRPSTASTSSRS